jgi:NAD(P)-binding Rossmann-like domain
MDMSQPLRGPRAPHDPRYAPLVAPHPGVGRDHAPTYRVAIAACPPEDDGPITQHTDADVVIVGSGFTGPATALFLAREQGFRATVLDANRCI